MKVNGAEKNKMESKIKLCSNCSSWDMSQGAIFQNRVYGQGKRVHNRMGKTEKYRCTVCGKDE